MKCVIFLMSLVLILLVSCSNAEIVNMQELKITSNVFKHSAMIPSNYTCDGDDVNPPLIIENIPETTKTLVLIVDDPDAPAGTWVHWVVWNIPVSSTTMKIKEYSKPGTQGINDFKEHNYRGPCPPSGTHRYFFKVYALDKELSLSVNSTKKDVEEAMQGHILAEGELIGIYTKERK